MSKNLLEIKSHFRKAVGALLVFDITKELTFENLLKWIEEIK